MSCPACNSIKNTVVKGQVYQCRKCNALHGTAYLGESYEHVLPYMASESIPDDRLRYFDFICLGSEGVTRRHGWYDPETKLIHQTG